MPTSVSIGAFVMTNLAFTSPLTVERSARSRHYLMTPPRYFAVQYAINPWMHPGIEVDVDLALRQWQSLVDSYRRLGHRVDIMEPVAGLPDMVYAANGALITPTATIAARFAYPQRAEESKAYAAWLDSHGLGPVHVAQEINEGEGDFLVVGDLILAGTGFRTAPAAHAEVARLTGMQVVSLELVNPSYYHLDTALAVLDDRTIAYYPAAFSPVAQATLATIFPDAIIATEADAAVFGLNAVSDGKHVMLAAAASGLAAQLVGRGFVPMPIDLTELLKGGGSVKCCTLELRRALPSLGDQR
ncbi:dimethylargininase [Microlunatus phosphovorus]|uniref:dimethylargininase n=1 Tax=Microlunatus phosphovorus TaxID=29405 RepID=UPI0002E81A54|nr:dimethylargininase [Microlunatus phosphovorus]